jgi:hypothetical protein
MTIERALNIDLSMFSNNALQLITNTNMLFSNHAPYSNLVRTTVIYNYIKLPAENLSVLP